MSEPLGRLDTIESAIAAIKDGRPVVVIDDEDRENEGDLIFAAELATPDLVAFMVRYTSGYICVPVTESDADRLDLPPMFRVNQDRRGAAYTLTLDAPEGGSTRISAAHRAPTIRLLAAQDTTSADPSRPGPIVPLRAQDGCGPRGTGPRPPCPAPGTSCRCAPRTAGCCAVPGTPRPPSTWPSWRACARPACSARSSARRTRRAWPAPRSCASSPTSTTSS